VSAAQHNGFESTAGTPDSRSTLISPQEQRWNQDQWIGWR